MAELRKNFIVNKKMANVDWIKFPNEQEAFGRGRNFQAY